MPARRLPHRLQRSGSRRSWRQIGVGGMCQIVELPVETTAAHLPVGSALPIQMAGVASKLEPSDEALTNPLGDRGRPDVQLVHYRNDLVGTQNLKGVVAPRGSGFGRETTAPHLRVERPPDL